MNPIKNLTPSVMDMTSLLTGNTKTTSNPEALLSGKFKSLLSDAITGQMAATQPQVETETADYPQDVSQAAGETIGMQTSQAENRETGNAQKPVEDEETSGDSSGEISVMASIVIPVMAVPAEIAEAELVQEVKEPGSQAETVAAVPGMPVSQMQYAQQIAQAAAAEEALPVQEQQVETENDIVIDSVETVLPQEQPDVSAQQQVMPEMFVDEEQQERFDSMVEQAAKDLEEIAKPEQPQVEKPVYEVPEELRAEVPEEVIEKQDQPELIRVAQKNVARVNDNPKLQDEIMTAPQATAAAVTQAPEPVVQASQVQQPKEVSSIPQRTMEQIQTEVVRNLENETMEFRMQLSPQDLGKIDVRMVMESGRITVEIIASSAKTAELLTRQTDGLIASLRVSGTNLHSVQVVNETQAQSGHMDQAFSFNMGQGQSAQDGQAGESQTGSDRRGDAPDIQQNQTVDNNQLASDQMLDYTV